MVRGGGGRQRAPVSYAEPRLDDEEQDSDQEEQPKARKVTPSKPRARKRSAAEAAADAGEASLLDIVKHHGAAISVAAKDWVDRYKAGRAAATAELLTFLLQSCGVDTVLTEEAVEDGEVDALRQELDSQAQEDGLDDHWGRLVGGGRGASPAAARAFRANYLELWDKLMREAYAADVALWDQYLLDKLSAVLISLNTSVVREFRFVAVLTAAQLVTSWIQVQLALGEARDTAERQLAAEERKKGKAAAERVAAFKRTMDRCHARVQELKSYADSLFQGIFAHRFRDCAEEIRATAIEGIGGWVRLHPGAFLTDQASEIGYLKYVAWALSDKEPRVRLAAVNALLALYSNADNKAALQDFTQRFSQRFGELFYDVNEAVAVKGIQLNTMLVRLKEAQASRFAQVYELLADESGAVRHAVAELVAAMLEEQGEAVIKTAAQAGGSGKKKGRRKSGEGAAPVASTSELQLAGLLQVMHLLANPPPERPAGGDAMEEDEEEEGRTAVPLERQVVAQVVDALFDRVPMLSDWPLLLSWAASGRAESHFGEAGVTNLLHLLRDALAKATGGPLLAGAPAGEARRAGQRDRQQAQATARQDATLALMKDLPPLLRKLQTDPAQAAALVGLVPEMKLEVYSLKRQEKNFAGLAASVKDVFLKHADAQVAKECVAALAAAARSGPDSIKDAAQLALTECTDDVCQGLATAAAALERADKRRLAAATAAYERSGGEEESQQLFDARAALVRLQALLSLAPGGAAADDEEVYEGLHRLLESAAGGDPLPGAIVRPALLCQLLLLMWRLRHLEAGEFADTASVADLSGKRDAFMAQLHSMLSGPSAQDIKDEAASALGDAFLVFSRSKAEGSPAAAACADPSDDQVHAFWEQCKAVLRREVEFYEDDDAAVIAAKMAAQRGAATKAAQLAVFQAVPQHAWLAAQLVSQWVGPEGAVDDVAVRHWAPVGDVVKEACRLIKKTSPAAMPSIYLDALKAAYARIEPAGADYDDKDLPADVQEFFSLSDRIAKTYAGFNSSAAALEYIVVEGAKHALRNGPADTPFLEGIAFFVRSLPAGRATAVQAAVEASAAPHEPSQLDDDWNTYHLFVEAMRRRAAKTKVKSALKKKEGAAAAVEAAMDEEHAEEAGAAGAAGTAQRAAPRRRRGISFAAPEEAAEGLEEDGEAAAEPEREPIEEPEEEEEEEAAAYQRASEQPSGRRRALPRGGSQGRGGRGQLALAAVEQEEAEEEEDEQGQQWEEEEEEEEVAVMPTEEQLPTGRRGGRPPRQRRLQPMFAAAEDEEEEEQGEEEEEEDEDADLEQVELHTRRGGSQRRAAAVDAAPTLPAATQEEEERPARRRRRG
ncbi:sister-chromatid cohesion 3 [Chlorella sorokiniana]|uniref:Sister-chromatid cohesion 3 n=1 Tax=Chlorella sorokiniana TaxID=3076 RepID=A0A2P6TCB5_CHLSO|nr:sister-chromatid cohesion 3 [Chlorella sorokiniana]|eukprot:PRW20268.1 sister-chromatid cohesion 3 [Chlorella sorokiniana]